MNEDPTTELYPFMVLLVQRIGERHGGLSSSACAVSLGRDGKSALTRGSRASRAIRRVAVRRAKLDSPLGLGTRISYL